MFSSASVRPRAHWVCLCPLPALPPPPCPVRGNRAGTCPLEHHPLLPVRVFRCKQVHGRPALLPDCVSEAQTGVCGCQGPECVGRKAGCCAGWRPLWPLSLSGQASNAQRAPGASEVSGVSEPLVHVKSRQTFAIAMPAKSVVSGCFLLPAHCRWSCLNAMHTCQ